MGYFDQWRPRKPTVREVFQAARDYEQEHAICGLRIEAPDGTPVFICTDERDHGGRLHHNAGAVWDDVAKELRRGTHDPRLTARSSE